MSSPLQRSRQRGWLVLVLLGLAAGIWYQARPRDLGRELRYAVFRGNLARTERLLRAHPELVNQTAPLPTTVQTLPSSMARSGSMNITDEFTMFIWDKFVIQPTRIMERDDDFADMEQAGLPALQVAILGGRLEMVRLLLDRGANLGQSSRSGHQAMVFAATSEPAIMRLLLERGGRLDAIDAYGQTPVQAAVNNPRIETLRMLLKAGADPNPKNQGHWTPLHVAVLGTRATNVITLLLQYGARPDVTNFDGKTPLDLAREYGHSNAVELLSGRQAPP